MRRCLGPRPRPRKRRHRRLQMPKTAGRRVLAKFGNLAIYAASSVCDVCGIFEIESHKFPLTNSPGMCPI